MMDGLSFNLFCLGRTLLHPNGLARTMTRTRTRTRIKSSCMIIWYDMCHWEYVGWLTFKLLSGRCSWPALDLCFMLTFHLKLIPPPRSMIMSQSLFTCMISEARLGRGERLWSSIRSRSNAIGFELRPEESATDVRPMTPLPLDLSCRLPFPPPSTVARKHASQDLSPSRGRLE